MTKAFVVVPEYRHQAEELMRSMPSRSTAEDDFYEYSIDVNTSIFAGTYSSIYLAGHSSSPGFALIGRVYEPSARLYPTKSAYLKVRRIILYMYFDEVTQTMTSRNVPYLSLGIQKRLLKVSSISFHFYSRFNDR